MIFNPDMKKHWTRKYGEGFEGHEPDSTLVEAALRKSLVDGSVFEIGAGAGYFTKLMEGWGYEVAATDLVVGDQMDISRERRGEYDNVVAIGVLPSHPGTGKSSGRAGEHQGNGQEAHCRRRQVAVLAPEAANPARGIAIP